MSLRIVQFEVGLMQNFNELVIDSSTGSAAVVDPAFEPDRILRLAAEHGARIETVLVTHTHHDHIEAVAAISAATGAVVRVGAREADAIRRSAPSATLHVVSDGESVAIGNDGVRALSTPGHTVDGISYVGEGVVMTGDTLFVGGVGRSDFAGGDARTLYCSLMKLASLPEETRVYPGHDYGQTPTSTIGWERATNPYLKVANEDEFVALRTGKNPPRPTRGSR